MLIYLLKMIACSAAFYGLYALLFRNEKMLVFNRFYLLGSLLFSFLIPLVAIPVEAPVIAPVFMENTSLMNQEVKTSLKPDAKSGIGIVSLIVVTFAVVSSCLMFRLIRNYLTIKKAVKQGQVFLIEKIQVVLLDQPLTPHSFLNTIFLNRDEYNSGKVETEVIQHEIAHIKQKHSWDICLLELVQVFAWFNPVIYLYKKSIKINHELLADASVVKQLDNVRSYQEILLRRAIAQSTFVLASSFTFYTTKKRLVMLTKKIKIAKMLLLVSVVLPVFFLLVVIFSRKVYSQKATTPDKTRIADVSNLKNKYPPGANGMVLKFKDRKPDKFIIEYPDRPQLIEDASTLEKVKIIEDKYNIDFLTKAIESLRLDAGNSIAAAVLRTTRVIVKYQNNVRTAHIYYEDGRVIKGDISSDEKAATFEKKYGIQLPPPPPPAPAEAKVKAPLTPEGPESTMTTKLTQLPAKPSSELSRLTKIAEEELRRLSVQQNNDKILKPLMKPEKSEGMLALISPAGNR